MSLTLIAMKCPREVIVLSFYPKTWLGLHRMWKSNGREVRHTGYIPLHNSRCGTAQLLEISSLESLYLPWRICIFLEESISSRRVNSYLPFPQFPWREDRARRYPWAPLCRSTGTNTRGHYVTLIGQTVLIDWQSIHLFLRPSFITITDSPF